MQEAENSRSGFASAVGPPSPAGVDPVPAAEDSYYEDEDYEDEDVEEVDYTRTGMHAEL